jgi:hypothetical protein
MADVGRIQTVTALTPTAPYPQRQLRFPSRRSRFESTAALTEMAGDVRSSDDTVDVEQALSAKTLSY